MASLSDSNAASRKRRADALDLGESDEEPSPCTSPRSASGEAPTSAASAFDADEGTQVNAGDVATQLKDLPCCSSDLLLRDVADMLLSTGQPAVVVVSEMGVPGGVIAEEDILRSYFQGAPWDVTVAEWMRGGGGTPIPAPAVPAGAREAAARASSAGWSVPPEQPLDEAMGNLLSPPPAAHRDHLGAGPCFLLVQGDEQGCGGGILSPVEVARALAGSSPRLAAKAAGTVAEVMEPLEEAPTLAPGFTVRQLLRQLLGSPMRAALVADGAGVRGLATAADAMWAFHQQIAHDMEAWELLSSRPGRAGLEGHAIPMDAPLQHAAAAMAPRPAAGEAARGESLRALLAFEPGSSSMVGVVSPSHLAKGISARSIQRLSFKQDIAQAQPSIPRRPLKLHKRRRVVRPHPVTVADVVAQRETATCLTSQTLGDAADILADSGRTAAVVTNEEGDVRGVLTENDLLTALVEGAPWDCKIDTWLRGGQARLPGFMVPALTLTPETTLAEAAAEMMAQLEEGSVGTGFACHHLLVRGAGGASSQAEGAGDGHRQVRLLSALDVARGMIDAVAAQAAGAPGGIEGDAVVEASDMTVEQAMKSRGILASCTPTDSLRKAFETMFESRQNCAVVVPAGGAGEGRAPAGTDGDGTGRDEHPCVAGKEAQDWLLAHGPVRGIITAADALRCFSERQRGDNATVASWLRALTAAERKTASQRSIRADESLSDAALAMGMSEVHHLVVLDRDGKEVVGVLSALDIVCTLGACYRFDLAVPQRV